jgi:hypothetical protein
MQVLATFPSLQQLARAANHFLVNLLQTFSLACLLGGAPAHAPLDRLHGPLNVYALTRF